MNKILMFVEDKLSTTINKIGHALSFECSQERYDVTYFH